MATEQMTEEGRAQGKAKAFLCIENPFGILGKYNGKEGEHFYNLYLMELVKKEV